ncbi:olfactory receptor 49-like [Thamnophis elegans]|uniref:olfactory receptor 49-like n=1 Tax=Thamnophis elegans TaxID=35005 RepID=UPI001378742E|nr:olfactory receptor 49-like [Thamnophis elegans]
MTNRTAVSEFILLGLTDNFPLEVSLFLLLFGIYLSTLIGNMLIIIITQVNVQLCNPMYFFLRYLAWVDIGYMSTVIPKALVNIATGSKSISLVGCFIQTFLYLALGTTEFLLGAIMSVDRCIAICNPLHYPTIMNTHICSLLVICCWFGGISLILVACIPLFLMPFCGPNVMNHFFCDNGPLMKLVCVDTSFLEMIHFELSVFSVLGTLSVNIVSFVKIISTILRIPSTTGRKKTFSTCAFHMTIVTLAYSSCIFMYIKPKGTIGLDYNKTVALLNIVMVPFLLPIILCLRNRQVQDALKAELRQWVGFFKKSI